MSGKSSEVIIPNSMTKQFPKHSKGKSSLHTSGTRAYTVSRKLSCDMTVNYGNAIWSGEQIQTTGS